MIELAALPPEGLDPARRRAALLALSDAALGERLASLARALRAIDAASLAEDAALPLGEVLASPFALRAVALGVRAGATTRHIELLERIDWTSRFGAADVFDPDHDRWVLGVLKTGKYLGFMTDAPFGAFDPSHVSKWGPHELLHRAAGFFHRRSASRWEHYLGARLNELVPVVTWYGPEQALRLDEGAFDRKRAGERPAAELAEARWLTDDDAALRDRAQRAAPLLREGILHFERELGAIDEELVSGRRVRAPHPFLDASSDATAYVVGHYDRLDRDRVADVLEVAADVEPDVGVYRDRVEALFDELLFAPLLLDRDAAAEARRQRRGFDLLHRAVHRSDDDLRDCVAAQRRGELSESHLRDALSDEDADAVLRDGAVPYAGLLDTGILETTPVAHALLEPARIERFAESREVWARAPLADRLRSFLEREEGPVATREMLMLESAIVRSARDDGVERLCVPEHERPSSLLEGEVIASDAFEVLELTHDVLSLHAEVSSGAEVSDARPNETVLLAGGYLDAVSLVPVPAAVRRAFERARAGALPVRALAEEIDRDLAPAAEHMPEDGAAWIHELVDAGALGWRAREPAS